MRCLPTSTQVYRNSAFLFFKSHRTIQPDSKPINNCTHTHTHTHMNVIRYRQTDSQSDRQYNHYTIIIRLNLEVDNGLSYLFHRRRDLSHHWSASTSRQPYVSCTGCQSADEWISCRSLAGIAPVYLADECTLVTAAGCRPLRSADNRTCLVKRSHNQFDDR